MTDTDFARHLTDFLSKYLPGQRNLSANTIASYRDAFKLFLIFCETEKKTKVDRLKLADISRELVWNTLSGSRSNDAVAFPHAIKGWQPSVPFSIMSARLLLKHCLSARRYSTYR